MKTVNNLLDEYIPLTSAGGGAEFARNRLSEEQFSQA